jgi:hypothetical protein
VKGARPASRHLVAADASGVVVLNTAGLPLSASTVRILREMAADNPRYLVAARAAGSVVRDDVRVGRDGLFVNDRKVAELAQVVETHRREDVLEVRGPVVSRGSVLGTLLGGWVGFSVGVVPGLGGVSNGVAWLAVTASTAIGGYLGFRWSSHETEGLVYRAPSVVGR